MLKKTPKLAGVKTPNAADKLIGARVRMRRMMLDMSQEVLGDALGLTFQQVQKYEKGTNRIGAGRLGVIAEILQVPVEFFYETVKTPAGTKAPDYVARVVATSDGIAIVKAFSQIGDAKARRLIVGIAEHIATRERGVDNT